MKRAALFASQFESRRVTKTFSLEPSSTLYCGVGSKVSETFLPDLDSRFFPSSLQGRWWLTTPSLKVPINCETVAKKRMTLSGIVEGNLLIEIHMH
jgi:hypothetical protein